MVTRVVRRCLKRSGKDYDPAVVKQLLIKLGRLAFRAFLKDTKTLFLTKVKTHFRQETTMPILSIESIHSPAFFLFLKEVMRARTLS